jgi:hypothetical protein
MGGQSTSEEDMSYTMGEIIEGITMVGMEGVVDSPYLYHIKSTSPSGILRRLRPRRERTMDKHLKERI